MFRKNGNRKRRKAALPGTKIRTGRWLDWSRQFTGRHERSPLRRPAPHFMLAGHAGSILQRIERWYRISSRLLSQLNLSITSRFSTRLSSVHQSNFHGSPQNHIQWFHSRTDVTPESTRAPEHLTSRLTVLRPYELHTEQQQSQLVETQFRQHLSTPALMRIFTRTEKSTSSSSSTRFETAVGRNHTQLIHRVLTERQRYEDLRRSLISREQKMFAPPTNTRLIETTTTQSIRTPQPTPAWGGQRADISQVNLERLTDQIVRTIDNRIIAHRERTGQVF